MSPMPKPSDSDKERFRSLFDDHPALEVKPMFGNLAAFVATNSQMCAGLFGPAIGIRLPEDQRAVLMAESGAGPFGPDDRPMKEYVSLPPAWLDGSGDGRTAELDGWVERAIEHTGTLPAKKPKPKKAGPKKK